MARRACPVDSIRTGTSANGSSPNAVIAWSTRAFPDCEGVVEW